MSEANERRLRALYGDDPLGIERLIGVRAASHRPHASPRRPEPLPERAPGPLVDLSLVRPSRAIALWHPYLWFGKLHALDGDPGVGKSYLTLALATALSAGGILPGDTGRREPQNVLLWASEDELEDTVVPRLIQMGANLARIRARAQSLSLDAAGFDLLEDDIRATHPALVVLDPLQAFMGTTLDMFRSNETRPFMARLADIASHSRAAVIVVRHVTKGNRDKPIYRGLGSIDILAACRSVLFAGKDPDRTNDSGDQVEFGALTHIKCNIGPLGRSLAYEIRQSSDDAGIFAWTGYSAMTAARMMEPEDPDHKSAIEEAVDFLVTSLAGGPVKVANIQRLARQMGIADRTLRRARQMANVVAKPVRAPGGARVREWEWQLLDSE